jgi:hypothetical protein
MAFQDLIGAAQTHFPNLQIKYKDQSKLMKFLSKILFFNKNFMTDYTSFNNTIYIPSQHFVKIHPVSSVVLFLYELVHLHYPKRKAYLSSLYIIWKLSQKLQFKAPLESNIKVLAHQLNKPWKNASALEREFEVAAQKIRNGGRPYEDPVFDMLDDLITKL